MQKQHELKIKQDKSYVGVDFIHKT